MVSNMTAAVSVDISDSRAAGSLKGTWIKSAELEKNGSRYLGSPAAMAIPVWP